jgi:hypothetical protein
VPDLDSIVRHLCHANSVQGGALLFSDGRMGPVLEMDEFADDRRVGARRLAPGVERRRETRGGRTVQMEYASSAEGIRALKAKHGIPPRPVAPRSAR